MFKKSNDSGMQEKLSRYVDPTGEFTNRDLALGEWYIRHRVMLREIVVGILITIIVIFGGFSVYQLGDYALFGYSRDEKLRVDLTRTTVALKAIHASQAPTPLEIASVDVYPGVSGKYDLVALAKNTNERWIALVTYRFTFDQGETGVYRSLILPGESLPLSALGTPANSIPDTVALTIKSVDWRRLDEHRYPKVLSYIAERKQFSISDFSFHAIDAQAGTVANQISFTLKNDSAYGYTQGSFYALLKNGDSVVGVKRFFVDSFRAGEERMIDLTSFADGLSVNDLEIIADIDIFTADSYLPVGDR